MYNIVNIIKLIGLAASDNLLEKSITPPFRAGLVETPLYKQHLRTSKTRDPAVNRAHLCI
jgi:hypothetical protein